jgi:hypothetical protein
VEIFETKRKKACRGGKGGGRVKSGLKRKVILQSKKWAQKKGIFHLE